MFDTID